jgi:hypothetical protein
VCSSKGWLKKLGDAERPCGIPGYSLTLVANGVVVLESKGWLYICCRLAARWGLVVCPWSFAGVEVALKMGCSSSVCKYCCKAAGV